MANLNVRMSEEEYKKIEEDAKRLGMSISTYIKFITKNINIDIKLKEAPSGESRNKKM